LKNSRTKEKQEKKNYLLLFFHIYLEAAHTRLSKGGNQVSLLYFFSSIQFLLLFSNNFFLFVISKRFFFLLFSKHCFIAFCVFCALKAKQENL
jgi:hypothetical protein